MSSMIEDICELLDSYNGRDKVVRLACYTLKLYGCLKEEKSWQAAGSRLSNARLMLRLFDDIPMIRHSYNYGLGKHESSKIAAVLGVLANIVDQVFLPVEKVCWLHEVGVIKLSQATADRLEVVSTALWAAGLYLSLIQTIRSMRHLWWSRDCLQCSEDGGEARRNVDLRLSLQTVTSLKLVLDITHAVSCLPAGCLWGEKIGSTKVAAIATTSSLIGIALYFAKKRLLK
ncbi:peroxisomal membrane protein 11C-like [Leptidea sinapis]|uniref:peroxisomal membrane protein 11C-like n=1 Tax=Leptidea sinapis TaxID=189913 RepID=UPI00213B8F9B|nr:peroxisomal membrane protein 11C-like [Leptidea sinapis]XP_050677779.1 peroxisomal membrane protein 11C-like [Leptidea sinapis]